MVENWITLTAAVEANSIVIQSEITNVCRAERVNKSQMTMPSLKRTFLERGKKGEMEAAKLFLATFMVSFLLLQSCNNSRDSNQAETVMAI